MSGSNIGGNFGVPNRDIIPANDLSANLSRSNETSNSLPVSNQFNDSFGFNGIQTGPGYGVAQLLNSPVFRQVINDLLNHILSRLSYPAEPSPGTTPGPQPSPVPGPTPQPTPLPGPQPGPTPDPPIIGPTPQPAPTPQPGPKPGPTPDPPIPDPQPPPVALKPAIYLYPLKTTEICVYIEPRGTLSIDIPKYNPEKGWRVLAEPNGCLTDLQPNLTTKESIEKYTNKFGLEYVSKSQNSGKYPYLYWESIREEDYAYNPKGWLIKSNEVKEFLNNKSEEIGFNEQEKDDFVSYWVYKIDETDKPFYKLSFFFTNEFDIEHPMNITPKPDSIYRVMLQVEAFNEEPELSIQPQEIERINREKFFVLEWGGYFVNSTTTAQSLAKKTVSAINC